MPRKTARALSRLTGKRRHAFLCFLGGVALFSLLLCAACLI